MDKIIRILKKTYPYYTYEEPALHQAVKYNDLIVVKSLIKYGYDTDIVDEYGKIAIAYVLKHSQLEILKILITAGSNIYQFDKYGEMQYSTTFRSGHGNVIKKYLEYQIDLNARDSNHRTAIHYLMDNNCYEISNILKKLDFDTYVINSRADTPMCLATRKRKFHWVKLLLEKGSTIDQAYWVEYTVIKSVINSLCDCLSSQDLVEKCCIWKKTGMLILIENNVEVNRIAYKSHSILEAALKFNNFQLVMPLLKKLAITETSGTPLIEINRNLIEQDPVLKSYYSDIKAELKKIMESELKNQTKVSYFDVLVEEDLNTLAKYFRSLKSRDDFKSNLNSFPHYSELLRLKFTEGVKREEEISQKEEMLSYLNFPPRFIRRMAVYYFSNEINFLK